MQKERSLQSRNGVDSLTWKDLEALGTKQEQAQHS